MRWLALLLPPVVVLGAAHELYLRNQGELDRTVSVLHPFWAAAAAAVLAAALVRRAGARAPFRVALWAYYLGGLAFALWSFLRALPLADHLARWTLDTPAARRCSRGRSRWPWERPPGGRHPAPSSRSWRYSRSCSGRARCSSSPRASTAARYPGPATWPPRSARGRGPISRTSTT